MTSHTLPVVCLLMCLCCYGAASFVEERRSGNEGKNEVTRRHSKIKGPFTSDWEVARYLKSYGTDVMIWRCRSAIKRTIHRKPLPYIDLYCEVVGRMRDVNWYHNGRKIDLKTTGSKYELIVHPHQLDDYFYSYWIDFSLRIHHANRYDKGVYTFEVEGIYGQKHREKIYLDLTEGRRRNAKYNRRRSAQSASPSRDRRRKRRRKEAARRRRRKGRQGKERREDRVVTD